MKPQKNNVLLNETVINGSRVFIEDGEVKIIFNDKIQETGYMSIEEARKLTIAKIEKLYAITNINESIRHGDWSEFDKLSDAQKIEIAKTWNDEMQIKYLSREPSLSEKEVFDTLIAKIKNKK